MTFALDLTDRRILSHLQHDARQTTKEIADKINKSVTTVHDRIRKLEDNKVIRKYVALIDNQAIDKSLIAFTTVQLKEHSLSALNGFEKEAVKFPEVMECYHLTGQFDFLLKVAIADMNEYHQFLRNKLATLANIGSVQTYFVLNESKHETAYTLTTPTGKGKKKGKYYELYSTQFD
jgi:Lrp/AsnC family transcriptional regulator, leucine-responsive regulatory protein